MARNRSRVESGQTTGLGSGYAKARRSGSGIVPGAHPERGEKPKAPPKPPKEDGLSAIQAKIKERKAQNAGARELTRRMGKR